MGNSNEHQRNLLEALAKSDLLKVDFKKITELQNQFEKIGIDPSIYGFGVLFDTNHYCLVYPSKFGEQIRQE
ncbi:MAG: hypothetical protein JWM44_1939 [Bacilli bacterium]|jgi:hypothetical protein|nr:hypothetical protein [Bacilli bacterium]